MKIGLFFGSFNPVHTGHLIVAEQMLEASGLDKVWFVLSPQNPFKLQQNLLDQQLRFRLLQRAVEGNNRFEASDVEFHLSLPSYTIHTLEHLHALHPEHQFSLIMGSDNLSGFEKWKDYESILSNYSILVYRRGEVDEKWNHAPTVHLFDVPYIHISATFIREAVRQQKTIRYLVPASIEEEVKQYYR